MALKEELTVKANGLYTYSDQLSEVPAGSLRVAKNIVINKDGLFSPRRGFKNLPGSLAGAIKSLHTFTVDRVNYLLSHRDDDTLAIYDDDTETWDDYAVSISSPTSANVIRTAQANKNLYVTSNQGIQKLDSIAGELQDSGAPEGLDIIPSVAAGTGTAIPDQAYDQTVGYQIVWGYKDANNNLILGPPSNRTTITIAASSGDKDIDLDITIPTPPVTVDWFVQVYRTATLPSDGDPGFELGLVLERNPTSGDITAGSMTLTDSVAEGFRGTALYTNATQQGALQANYEAPQSVDMALYQNHMFYANTESKYQIKFTLLATDPSGPNATAIVDGDTITINSVVYTARNVPSVTDDFLVPNTGSLGDDIGDATRDLVKVINRSPNNTTLWAIHDSGEDDLPGKIRIIERDFGVAPNFTVISTKGIAWSPDLTTAEPSDNEKHPNRLYYSKFQQPESVPVLQYFDVGAANDEITRILPLRSILLIFTTAGIYKLTGVTSDSFQISLLDDTAILLAPESLVALNNNAVGLFDQGIAQVSYGTVQVLSRPIEGDINKIIGSAGDNISDLTFGISYETDRKYIIGLPRALTDTKASICYVYNTITQSWTTYDLAKTGGIVRKQDNKLYMCDTGSVIVERKSFSANDFAGPEIDVTVTNVDGKSLTLNTTTGMAVGYQFFQASNAFSIIDSIDFTNNIITVVNELGWLTGAAEVRPFINIVVEWNPITADTPNILKQFSEATLLVNYPIKEVSLSFKSLTSGFFESIDIVDYSSGPWGLFPWGQAPWGGVGSISRYRTLIPRDKQRDSAIILKVEQNTVFNDFEISGWSLIYRNISQRVTR